MGTLGNISRKYYLESGFTGFAGLQRTSLV